MTVNPLLVATTLALEDMDNATLASANLAITGFGCIDPAAKAFKPLRDAALIKENGYPADEQTLLDGLSFVINKRVEAGTFN